MKRKTQRKILMVVGIICIMAGLSYFTNSAIEVQDYSTVRDVPPPVMKSTGKEVPVCFDMDDLEFELYPNEIHVIRHHIDFLVTLYFAAGNLSPDMIMYQNVREDIERYIIRNVEESLHVVAIKITPEREKANG